MITKKREPKITANQLTRQALKVFDLCGFNCWRQNNGGVYDPAKKVFRRGSSTPGISDIIGYHRKTGQFLAVEVKVGRDKLSPYQERFLADVMKAGGMAIELRNVGQLEQIINKYKLS